jgi:cation:H+ antiporter
MRIALPMVLGLMMVLFGAELFTNAVEWLGRKLRLGQGAVGSILAALGTALPETAVPVTAILSGGGTKEAEEVGIGGILGAPFLLVTLGSLVMAIALVIARKNRRRTELAISLSSFDRDMTFFMMAYSASVFVGCVNKIWFHNIVPFVLVGLYVVFLIQTLREKESVDEEDALHPLYLQWKSNTPNATLVLIQLAISLLLIVSGAKYLTVGVERLAFALSIPTFVLSALLIPLATELPETLNSVVWIRQGKDALAVGNITGAMVFQSTLVPALGIWLTPWKLDGPALLTGVITLAAAAVLYALFRFHRGLVPSQLFAASLFYWILPVHTIAVRYRVDEIYWIAFILLSLLFCISVRIGFHWRSAPKT